MIDHNKNKTIVCSIATSDSSAHAGQQNDLRVIQDLGGHGVCVSSGITAQNSQAIDHSEAVSTESFAAQWHSLSRDLNIDVVKVGLLLSVEHIQQVTGFCRDSSAPFIVDPVLSSTSGSQFNGAASLEAYRQLIAHCELLTPNLPETELLLNTRIESDEDVIQAAQTFRRMGAKAILIKGGHRHSTNSKHGECVHNDCIYDYFTSGTHSFWLAQPRRNTQNNRGTGCALASAIASFLAQGKELVDAVVLASAYVQQGLASGFKIGQGSGLLGNSGWPLNFQYFPTLLAQPEKPNTKTFTSCDTQQLGLYPVVDSIEWLERLLKLDVKTIQLRIKDVSEPQLDIIIEQAVLLEKQYQARLFINDYWQLAIKHGAYGVHLGQEDMTEAPLESIRRSGLRLGLSSHSEYEWARAASVNPSYIALGAVFPTDTKVVQEIGLQNLYRWSQTLNGHFPLVAIGGIQLNNIDTVLSSGVGSVAVVSAILSADDYQKATRQLQFKIGGVEINKDYTKPLSA